jgi:hypothetical protein
LAGELRRAGGYAEDTTPERTVILLGYYLEDCFETMLSVSRINALGAVANRKVAAADQTRSPLILSGRRLGFWQAAAGH